MDIAVRDFVGCRHADIIGLEKIALIAGRNKAGKSSILQAAAATISSDPLVRGIDVIKLGGALVRDGASSGKCLIRNGQAKVIMSWPDCKYEAQGTGLVANPYACGLKHIGKLNDKDRTFVLMDLLGAHPTRKDVQNFLADHFDTVNDAMVETVYGRATEMGWDGYYKSLREKGAKAKGVWEKITGQNYGTKKAEDWVPEGWDEQLASKSQETLERDVVNARSVLERLLQNVGADSGRLEELDAAIDAAPAAQTRKGELQEELEKLETDLQKTKAEHDAIDLPPIQKPFECPHCGEPLHFGANVGSDLPVVKADKLGDQSKKVKELRERKTELDHGMTALRRLIRETSDELVRAQAVLTAAQAAREEKSKVEKGGVPQEQVDLARQDVDQARQRLEMFKAWTAAANAQRSIVTNLKVQKGVKPDGIRKAVLTRQLKDVNERLRDLCSYIDLDADLRIDDDLRIRCGMREYWILSHSEQLRADWILTLLFAQITKAPLVILDQLDSVHNDARPKVLKLLAYVNIPALIGMMAKDENTFVPDLARAGMGDTYWMEEEELKRLTRD